MHTQLRHAFRQQRLRNRRPDTVRTELQDTAARNAGEPAPKTCGEAGTIRVVADPSPVTQHLEARLRAGEEAALAPWRRLDSQFHRTLVPACDWRTLMATHAAIFDRYQRHRNLTLGFRGNIASHGHEALRGCALSRDAATAREALTRNILGDVDHDIAGALCEVG